MDYIWQLVDARHTNRAECKLIKKLAQSRDEFDAAWCMYIIRRVLTASRRTFLVLYGVVAEGTYLSLLHRAPNGPIAVR